MTVISLTKDPLNLIVAGVGGQGNIVISSIIGDALIERGYLVIIGETFGASQRGGAVMSHIRISNQKEHGPLIPDGHADILLGIEPLETLRVLKQYGNPDVITILNPRPINPVTVLSGESRYPDLKELIEAIKNLSGKILIINATEEAQKLGNIMFTNVILVGALTSLGILPLDAELMRRTLRQRFPQAFEANMKAFNIGIELARGVV